MKVRAIYRPEPGVLALRLRCKCVVILKGRRGLAPKEWFCKNHEAKADRRSNFALYNPVLVTPVPPPRRRVSKKALLELIGGPDAEAAIRAGAVLGERLRRKREA